MTESETMDEDPDGQITCWCGAQGTYEDLFDESGLAEGPCGGLGELICECGGDQCVCHHHGSVDCDGCEDCDPVDGDDEDWDDEDWDDEDWDDEDYDD